MVSATWIDGDMARRRVQDLERECDELRAEVERCREVVKTFTLGNAVLEVENVRLRNLLAECFPLVEARYKTLNSRLRNALGSDG